MAVVTATRAPFLLSERDWQTLIVDYARLHGWEIFHVLNSRGMTAGWPDLVVLRAGEALFVELKREDGKVTGAQARVLELLESAGCECHVWRPSDEAVAFARLGRRPCSAPSS